MDALNSDANQPLKEFKADLTRKTPCRAEKRKCIEAEIVSNSVNKSQHCFQIFPYDERVDSKLVKMNLVHLVLSDQEAIIG